jgi:hypothetical protein
MTVISIARIALPSLALVAAVAFGVPYVWPKQPVESRAVAAPAAPAGALLAPSIGDQGTVAPTTAPALAAPSHAPSSGDAIKPAFDTAVIGKAGDAVIAGTAAPGAAVELLRNGEPQDRAVADQSGQFVMVLPQLPPGNYELTLRSTQPDGRQEASQQSVAVSLQPSFKDQLHAALVMPDRASVALTEPVAPSATCHPSRARKH